MLIKSVEEVINNICATENSLKRHWLAYLSSDCGFKNCTDFHYKLHSISKPNINQPIIVIHIWSADFGEKLLITVRWIIFGCVFLLIWVIFGEKFAKYYCDFFPFTIVIDSHQIDRVITITTENSMKLISLFLHKFDILCCSKKYLKAYVANAFERILNRFSVDVGIFWESPRAQSIVLHTVSINQFSRKRHYLETCRVCKLNDFHDCPIFRI